ncbi:MAG: radical SAM protein [Desulfobacula sp.]|nr:radical SAM protein [Desulfobacula sp.]
MLQLTLELTARCNNNCIHCYNNLPPDDPHAINNELSTKELKEIIDQAVDLGVLWVCITGGEALLRDDFFDLYKYIKKKGLIVSVFTNATLISKDHIKLFKKYPPRDIEVTVYGLSEKKYTRVARTNNYFIFIDGLEKLIKASMPVSLKATIMKSNFKHLKEITEFCRNKSYKNFRFDPFLVLRTDKNKKRNQDIINQRLSVEEIITLEQEDSMRMEAVKKECARMDEEIVLGDTTEKLFQCGAGLSSCMIDCNGFFRLCGSLVNDKCIYDLKKGSLKKAWEEFVPGILNLQSENKIYLDKCGKCSIIDLCTWCPAKADLETNKLDGYSQYFCSIASKRYEFCNS